MSDEQSPAEPAKKRLSKEEAMAMLDIAVGGPDEEESGPVQREKEGLGSQSLEKSEHFKQFQFMELVQRDLKRSTIRHLVQNIVLGAIFAAIGIVSVSLWYPKWWVFLIAGYCLLYCIIVPIRVRELLRRRTLYGFNFCGKYLKNLREDYERGDIGEAALDKDLRTAEGWLLALEPGGKFEGNRPHEGRPLV